jgi:uncharacterized C2H2 Zn-finger protein
VSERPPLPEVPRCSGFTREGWTCRRTVLTFKTEDTEHGVRLWCSDHAPEGASRYDAHAHVEQDPDRRCQGFRRDVEPCRKTAVLSVSFGGAEHRLCDWHFRIWQQDGVLQPPPKSRRRALPVEAISDEEAAAQIAAQLAEHGAEVAPTAPGAVGPSSLRRRVEGSAELLYSDIEDALRQTLRSATKERFVRCPECSKGFRVKIPDYAAMVSAAKALLEIVVGRPKPAEPPPPPPMFEGELDLKNMSTDELRAFLLQSRAELADG